MSVRHRVGVLGLLGVMVTLAACGGGMNVPSPAPIGGPVATALPPVEPATIALPIAISLRRIERTLAAQFPAQDSLTAARCAALGGAVCHQYVYRRDSLRVAMTGDRVDLRVPLRYRGRVALAGVAGLASCGYAPEPMKRAELHAATSLFWRTDWRLASRNTALEANLVDPCEVTALRVNATPLMQRIVRGQLEDLRVQLDSALPALADLRPAADSLWRTLRAPVALDSQSTAWASLHPQDVALARPLGREGALTTALVLTLRPRVTLGGRPAPSAARLPALSIARSASGIHVPVDIELPFADLGARVTRLMKGEVAGTDVVVDSVGLWGVADTVAVRVGVHGTVSGNFYLTGRIGWDAAARRVLVRDLRYTLESESRMSRLKATLGAFRINRALDRATGHGELDVGAQLDSLRASLGAKLNRPLAPGVVASGRIDDVKIIGFATTPTAFVLRVVVDGTAKLTVE